MKPKPTSQEPSPPIVAFRHNDSAFPLRVYRRLGDAKPMHAPTLHGHRFFVLFLADGGHGKIGFFREEVEVVAGHLHLLAPGELHDTSQLGSVTGWAAEFTEELLDGPGGGVTHLFPRPGQAQWVGFFSRAASGPAHAMVPEVDRPRWGRRFELLQQELEGGQLGHREMARSLLQINLLHAARLIAPRTARDILQPLVNEVFDVIDVRYAEPISLRDVARAVGRSPSHLTAILRRETGMTVLDWITERRMAEARRRLRETDEDIAIVAERVGYRDATYFIRQFRRAHQVTPRAFRIAHRGTPEGRQ